MSRSRAGAVAGKTMVTATVAPAGDARALLWMNLAAVALVLLSAFAVIYSTHACRQLYAQLQVLESSQWGLQEDYGRLLLGRKCLGFSPPGGESCARGAADDRARPCSL